MSVLPPRPRGRFPAAFCGSTIRRAGAIMVCSSLTACGNVDARPELDAEGAEETTSALPTCAAETSPLQIDTVARGLAVPWDAAFLPDGTALVTERAGRIRVVDEFGLRPEPWATVEVDDRNEVGLMGIDITDRGADATVFVNHAYRSNPTNPLVALAGKVLRRVARALDSEQGHTTTMRVLRYPVSTQGDAGEPETIVADIPSSLVHGGGALRLGPDSMVYVASGDAGAPRAAQASESLRGKLLRFDREGGVPDDNPWTGSPVWAKGVRHVQGLAWDAATTSMLAIDHGPTGMPAEQGRRDRDELNVVDRGDNLGWPVVTGTTTGGPWTSAAASWTPAIAPAGLELYEGAVAEWNGSAFVTALRGVSLRRVEFDRSSGTPVPSCEEVLLASDWGRLRLVRQAPDGSLWVGTSNRDGRGTPHAEDDVLLRLRPRGR